MYDLILPLLFRLKPETAHNMVLSSLRYVPKRFFAKPKAHQVQLMGLTFSNQIGLAAGLDKNGDYVDALAKLGFGFIEVGTVTPKPQAGNPQPRLFRLQQNQALINRMGFNNKGVDYLVERIKHVKYQGVLGINIGKNKATPNNEAVNDYLTCLEKVYPVASYITINVSSPNTPGLRHLQQKDELEKLIGFLKKRQLQLASDHQQYKPLVVKISPDEQEQNLADIAEVLLTYKIDGVIATNTTNQRSNLIDEIGVGESGGLSGKPLQSLALNTVSKLAALLQGKIPIIGVGGINDADSANAMLNAGASLIQLYSGLIYKGPQLLNCLD